MPDNPIKIKLFISYSHDDEAYFNVFSEGVKKVIKNAEQFEWSIWDDTRIHVGNFWDEEIQNNIKECNVALLLVSVSFMASPYIKENEFKEFINRYAEKNILIVPVVFKPCDFNRWTDLGKLQFFKPKGANYGKPEIDDFTYSDIVRFRETDGILLPNPNIERYHLDLVKKIEESYQQFLGRTENIKVELPQLTLSVNVNKLSDSPKPSILFTGRDVEIKEFKKIFNSFRIFAIEGLGGTGKTEFTAKCIEELIQDKNRIIWLNGSAQSNFDVFVENTGYGDVLKGKKKSDIALYLGLKDLIEKDERVIFWDNFNDYEDSTFSKFLSFAYQHLSKATIVLITRTDPQIKGIISLPIVKLEGLKKDAIEFAKKIRESDSRYNSISDLDLEKISLGADGHPLAIELSMLLMGYGKTAQEIMHHMPEFSKLKKVEEFSKRLFLDIFYHNNTSEEERECFLKCSVFKEKISLSEINFLHNGNDVFYLLAGLMDKLLITYKEGFYEIHPLVRSFSYEILNDKKAVHKKAATYFIAQRTEVLDASLEEKIFYHLSEAQEWQIIADSIEITGREFIQLGQLGLISELINKLTNINISRPVFELLYGDIAQIKGEWDKALTHFEKARHTTEDNIVKAEGMIKYGEILFRKGDIKESLPCFESAFQFAKTEGLRNEEARALNDIGLFYEEIGKVDKAYEKLNAALKIRLEIGNLEGIGTSYNNIANIFDNKGKHDKALEYYNKSRQIADDSGDKIGLALTYENIAGTLRSRGKLDEAFLNANLALKLGEEIGDKERIGGCLNVIGRILRDQGKLEESLSKFLESLKVKEELGDKLGVMKTFTTIGISNYKLQNLQDALFYFFKSIDLSRRMEDKSHENIVTRSISVISKKLGKDQFKEVAIKAFEKIDFETKVNVKEFLNEPLVRESPKVGRNDPCPCGNGKKYKHCHGAN